MKIILASISGSLLGFLLFGAIFVTPDASANPEVPHAMVKIINTKGEQIGTAMLTQKDDTVQIQVRAKNLPPGVHGIHFHETGACTAPDFKSAGAHLNVTHKQHGFNNPKGFHVGDLPNVEVGRDGTLSVNITTKYVSLKKGAADSLLKPGGSALVIHEKADDYVTDPAGNSGDRIACGAIL